jgi:glycosyltransferase involved in cell wall biosynthesis
MKLLVFIPAINEEKTLGETLDLIPKKITGVDEIVKLVVDDGSTDQTAEVARKHGAIVLSNGTQKHLAYSFQKAIAKALELGADVVVNIDADLQFNPKQIPELVAPIIDGSADFVAADRFTDKETGKKRKPANMPTGKYWANVLGAFIVGLLSRRHFRDVTCGFRAYSRNALLALNINSGYTYTQESFQVLAFKKFNIKTIPVEVKYFPGRKSRVVTNFLNFLFGSALNILRAFRDYAPLTFFGGLGIVFFLLGSVATVFIAVHWVTTGGFSPYISVGLAGVYLISLAIFIWGLGLVADMLDRVLNNQEKILELAKRTKYEKSPTQ